MSRQDALVLVIMSLVAVASIEGVILYNATPVGQTVTQTVVSTFTFEVPASGIANATVTAVSTLISTTTATATKVDTKVATQSVTATSTETVTSTATSAVTTTSTRTVTSTTTTTSSPTTTTTRATSTASSATTTSSSSNTSTTQATSPGSCGSVCQVTIVPGAGSNTTSNGYSPATLVVVIGVNSTVLWVNKDIVHHTVTFTSPVAGANSVDLPPDYTFTVVFSTPGTYSYHCLYHSWMHGTIIVKSKP